MKFNNYSHKREDDKVFTAAFNVDFGLDILVSEHGKEHMKHQIFAAARQVVQHAIENGYMELVATQLNDRSQSHTARMVFMHPEQKRNLVRDLAEMEGGRELIEKYF